MNAARKKWQSLMKILCVPESKAEAAWAVLTRLYGESHRHYHNMEHIDRFVSALECHGGADVEMPVWFALFYHDSIYDPRLHSNEARSADLSFQEMMNLGLPTHWCGYTDQLIRATQKHQPLTEGRLVESSKLFIDCDLVVLASSTANYDRYAAAIRKEYAHIPEAEFCQKRADLLEAFLKRDAIFLSPAIHCGYERAARANVAREIARLRQGAA